jgi:hypothetical protein
MTKAFKAFPSPKDCILPNDDEFEDIVLLDEEDELEEQYLPNMKKAQKRQAAAADSKKNRWRIRD